MKKSIDEILVPKVNQLQFKDGVAFVDIADAELDPIRCEFTNGDSVKLDVEKYTYITLDSDNLELLLELIVEAEEWYKRNLD